MPESISMYVVAPRCLSYAVWLCIRRRRANSAGAKADARREVLNWADSRGQARVVDITDDLPAVVSLIPHIHMESIYVAEAQVDVHAGACEVGSRHELRLVNGGIQVPGVSRYAQSAPYLIKSGYRKSSDDE